jgi:glycosyl hydrolase family 1
MRRLVPLFALAVTLVAFGFPAGNAAAAPGIQYGIEDDAWVLAGPRTLNHRLDFLESLGVTTVRFSIRWDEVAPTRPLRALASTDPAYRWGGVDAVLQGLHARGIQPVVTLYGTPAWANGGRKPNVAPASASSFADFAYAAAKRYPFVRRWTIWNEPNQVVSLATASPRLYVTRLLNPAYVEIHRANRNALVAGGVTAPRGNTAGLGPLAWIRGMKAAHAKLDAYAHNPYPTRPSTESPTSGACAYCDVVSMANLGRLLKEVQRDFGGKQIWLTEYGYQTDPPDQLLGVPPATQALYESEAALRAYQLPHVTLLIHFLLRDEPDVGRFQSGLFTSHGSRKPDYLAFRLPLAEVTRSGSRVVLWGQVRPGKGARRYRLQVRTAGGAWQWLGSTRGTTTSGFVSRTVNVPQGTLIRIWSPDANAYGWPLLVR